MPRISIGWFILAVSLPACALEPTPPAEERAATEAEVPSSSENDIAAIEALREMELAAFNSGDVQGFMDIVTDDVVFDAPGRPAATGKDAIRSMCEATFARFDYDASYATEELVVDRDWAFDRGTWIENRSARESGEQSQVTWGILQIYRRQGDGSWKLARSMWNEKSRS